jgi:plasmid stabilization system protein ParE
MAHLRTPEADSDLDEIWYYVASNSGSLDIADRFIDSITDRFFLLARHPNIGRARDEDLRLGLRSFPVGQDEVDSLGWELRRRISLQFHLRGRPGNRR